MSDTTQAAEEPTQKFSPFAGCSIFIIAGILVLGMIGFTTWSYFKVKGTIENFTSETPKPVTLLETENKKTEQTALQEKLTTFKNNINTKQKGELSLNAEEMNLAIASFEILKPLRENLYVTAIRDGQIEAQISYEIKSHMGSDQMRYLTGSLVIEPELVEGGAFPRIVEIKPDKGGSIPEEFQKFISESLLHKVVNDDKIGPLFKSLSAVEIKGNTLIVTTDPNYKAAETIETDSQQSSLDKFMIGFGIIAVIFLAIVSFIIILSRRKAKES